MSGTEMAWIGVGANVGPARAGMVAAVHALSVMPSVDVAAVSSLYRTRPVGPVDQADFLNAVVGLRVPAADDPTAGAMALLAALKGIERSMGRVERERWGPRELDLDLLLFGAHRLRVEREAAARSLDAAKTGVQWLEVPHPEAGRRSFVLVPLAELAPELRPPGWGETVEERLARTRRDEGPDAVRVIAEWDAETQAWRTASRDRADGVPPRTESVDDADRMT